MLEVGPAHPQGAEGLLLPHVRRRQRVPQGARPRGRDALRDEGVSKEARRGRLAARESESFREHHLTRRPALRSLLELGWTRGRIMSIVI